MGKLDDATRCGLDGEECTDDCEKCATGYYEMLCDDCRFYAAQDGD